MHIVNKRQQAIISCILSFRYGGIIPPRAQDLHRSKIAEVYERCLHEANIKPDQIDAIAVTTCPGGC